MISRCHLPTGNANPQKNRKRGEKIPDDEGTDRLLARMSRDIVSDRDETQLMQVRTHCEHKRAGKSSAREIRPN
jgi:hypothetical protein